MHCKKQVLRITPVETNFREINRYKNQLLEKQKIMEISLNKNKYFKARRAEVII